MKLIIDIPTETYDYWKEHKYEYVLSEAIANGTPYNPTGDLISRSELELADEVWELYEKHHSHLATHVIEFGNELKELLDKYQKDGIGYPSESSKGEYIECPLCHNGVFYLQGIDKGSDAE